jgi:UDP-N-acetyl-D-mannosaminuronic acid dehydrogenase
MTSPLHPSSPAPVRIAVIGMGYVGIPCAALFADVPGFRVSGVQRRSPRSGWKIDCLNGGQSPFGGDEPGLAELLRRVVLEKRTFHVTDDIAACRGADAILIDVQTPVDSNHVPRYESLRQVTADVGRQMKRGTLVVLESTVAPGTTQHVVLPILEQASGLKAGGGISNLEIRDSHFFLAFSYERVMPGKLLQYLIHLPRIVGGIDAESTGRAVELYRNIVQAEIIPSDCLTAEVAKTVENTYRDVNIAFANEMALVCESLGVDVFEVQKLVNARPDRHMHLPGAGVGGHCLPKDPWLLNHGVNSYGDRQVTSELLAVARRINDAMPLHMAELVEQALADAGQPLRGASVAVLGIAYLENSDDTRNTPAVPLIRALCDRGADVVAHDPYVRPSDFAALGLVPLAPGSCIPAPVSRIHDPASCSPESCMRAPVSCSPASCICDPESCIHDPVAYTQNLVEALQGADCAVIVTKHREYLGPDLLRACQAMRTRLLVDGRGCIEEQACTKTGLSYRGLGQRKVTNRE